ncbi:MULTISPECIES: DMT family transporter [Paenibacillus]|uniref:DMT family transporter n=1 Tax=Paenibacillus TaxID=44249 RepID=UPI0004DEF1AA|nr:MULTISPECIES: DMT family transporter [Paenibacillus]MBY0023880.1 DMT family transporter [Paenibacillus polymyxa]MBY0056552.1 DMT family transporter [Paenibacillus polymyxa]MBY0071899.1 DMT family transporter [Paenibacillus polymyxa]MBY0080535.1 DMT family transporter [Paenibacillus polymyxa]MBZ6443303.1 DMT family transporter [Paenibacillus polymyxa]
MSRSLYAALLLLSLIWGGSFMFIKVLLLHQVGPWTIVFLRSSFGLIFIILLMLLIRKPFKIKSIPWKSVILVACVNMVLPWTLIGFSETRIASSMASVLNATTPIWTMLVGLVFFGAIFHRLQWLGMGLAFIGIIILLGINPASIISVDPVGFGCMLLATLCYGFGTQLSKRFLSNLSMYQATFATLFGAAAGGGIMMVIVERPDLSIVSVPGVLGSLIGLGVLGSGVAYILFNYMILRGSAEFASSVTYFVPVSAIVWGFLLLNEHIGWNVLTGLVLILGGVFMANQRRTAKLRVITPSENKTHSGH